MRKEKNGEKGGNLLRVRDMKLDVKRLLHSISLLPSVTPGLFPYQSNSKRVIRESSRVCVQRINSLVKQHSLSYRVHPRSIGRSFDVCVEDLLGGCEGVNRSD